MERIAVIDNYDSFTYNLVHALEYLNGKPVEVFRNDRVDFRELDRFEGIVLSPGPGVPDEAGALKEVIHRLAPTKRILGVCLGHQAIAEAFGGRLINLRAVFHGVSTIVKVLDRDDYLYRDVPEAFDAGRYHSWIVSREGLPDCFRITAEAEDGEIMSITHRKLDVKGVQYHPESVMTEVGERIISNWLQHNREEGNNPKFNLNTV